MEIISITEIINDKSAQKNLPTQFTKTEQISTLTKTIPSTIFKNTEFIKTLDTQYILDNMNILPCSCTTLSFADPNHEHIATGDMPINKLKKLLCKSPKYSEPVSINYSNC